VVAGFIEWDWERIEQVSLLAEGVRTEIDSPTVVVRLAAGQGRTWQKTRDRGWPVFLRTFLLRRTLRAGIPVVPVETSALVIESIVGDQITLRFVEDAEDFEFPLQSFLYRPKRDSSGAPRRLVHPRVADWLEANGPFGAGDCDQPHGLESPPDIGGFDEPRNSYRVIGVYDGGGGWNCGVFRPAGACRMRQVPDTKAFGKGAVIYPFCHVCRYILVNRIDPRQHPRLEKDYPEDCHENTVCEQVRPLRA